MGIGRTAASLHEGIDRLKHLKHTIGPQLQATDFREVKDAVEVTNMLDVGLVIGTAALTRTETRGAHFRLDYPDQTDTWRTNIVATLNDNGDVCLKTVPVVHM
jgi:succinate dehydrogenase/fumarate reductase flavoprotein subunit